MVGLPEIPEILKGALLQGLKTYRTVICIEPYLINLGDNYLISSMNIFRLISHDLKTERHNRPRAPASKRLRCTDTNVNIVDDDF